MDNYNSYNNENSKLSGWKRYPSRKEYINHEPSNDNQQVQNKFELLPSGYKFNGKIVFHNLKKEELSCLIWCLTLENSPYNKHSLGHAKPLGAGSVQIKIDEKNSKIKQNIDGTYIDCSTQQWVDQFIGHMNDRFEPSGKWRTSAQIEYLMAITDDDIENSNDFSYLELDNFRTIKNQKASLPSLELNGKQLSRADIASETSASLAFCKGRLETLFDENSTFQQQQKLESEHYAERRKKQAEKAKLANEKQELKNSDLPPFERIQKQIELMVKNQDALSATEKKNKTKELREITKEIKELELTPEQAGILTQLFEGITFCPKDTNKAIKYLEKLL